MNGLDDFLFDLKVNNPVTYSVFGDCPYGASCLRCIRSYFQSIARIPLTDPQVLVNQRWHHPKKELSGRTAMSRTCVDCCQILKITTLGKITHIYFLEQTCVVFLLYNLYVCVYRR